MKRDETSEQPEQELSQYSAEDELPLQSTEKEALLIQSEIVIPGSLDPVDLTAERNNVKNLAGENTSKQAPEYAGEQEKSKPINRKYDLAVMWLLVLLLSAYFIYKFLV
jgi:hypothetical protein